MFFCFLPKWHIRQGFKANEVVISTLSSLAICIMVSSEGCAELAHHLLTVAGSLPNCMANQRLVFPLSTNMTYILFILPSILTHY